MDVAENHTARASKDRTSLFDGWTDRIGPQTGRMLRDWLDSGTDAGPARNAALAAPVALAPREVSAVEYPDDGIPALDDKPEDWEAWPSSESAPATSTARDAINKAVPLRQPKMTVGAWLDGFAAKLAACETLEGVEAAILCEEACRASKTLTGEARTQLKALIANALALHRDC